MSVPLTNEFFGQVSACKFILHIGASSRKGCGTKNLGKNKGFFLHFVSEKSKPHRWIERSEIQLMFARQPTFYKKLDQKLCRRPARVLSFLFFFFFFFFSFLFLYI